MLKFRERGFTLIELLVVIAIIAILVLIIVVALDPVKRLNESNNERANYNVRSYASAISVCITGELQKIGGDPFSDATCADNTGGTGNYLYEEGYGNKPDGVEVLLADSDGDGEFDKICLYMEGEATKYASWESNSGLLIPSPSGVNSC